eukprot:NODE_6568_length_496_cov_265.326531.p6 GENE.NODE_6568_length_496_cov_265.326531~~NODE_6568_length_496_cov_265.326531.p6  ORF type:complete len:70 (+),score=3.75 NODE_6568_length_496_cov_265.326531:114-323(+)
MQTFQSPRGQPPAGARSVPCGDCHRCSELVDRRETVIAGTPHARTGGAAVLTRSWASSACFEAPTGRGI